MTYAAAKQRKDELEAIAMRAGAKLQAYPKGEMGLVGSEVRNSEAFKADMAAYRAAEAKSNASAKAFIKAYKKQYLAERQQKRMGK